MPVAVPVAVPVAGDRRVVSSKSSVSRQVNRRVDAKLQLQPTTDID